MYIVTGGAGMIGSALIWQLNQQGSDDIWVVDNLGSTDKWKNLVNRRFQEYLPREEFIELVETGKLPETIDCIFHLGACSSTTERNVDYLFSNNLEYSKALATYALSHGIRFINASSAATYGNGEQGFDDSIATLETLKPLNAYGYSKHLFDLWALRTGSLKLMPSVKFFNVYGPNEYHKGDMRSVVAKGFAEIKSTGRLRLFASDHPAYPDGGQKRDFIYVKDCAAVLYWLAMNEEANGLFNLGTGRARSWNDLAAALFSAMGLPCAIDYIPMPEQLRGKYQNFTQAPMQRLQREGCPIRSLAIDCQPDNFQASTEEPLSIMHSLEDGVTDYVRNYLMQDDPHL